MSLKDKLKKPVKTTMDIINEAPADKSAEPAVIITNTKPERRKTDAPEDKQTERVAVYFTKNEMKELKRYCFENDIKMAAFLREKALSTLKRSNTKAV